MICTKLNKLFWVTGWLLHPCITAGRIAGGTRLLPPLSLAHLRRRVFVTLWRRDDACLFHRLLPLHKEVVEAAVAAPAQLRLLALDVQHSVDGIEVCGI